MALSRRIDVMLDAAEHLFQTHGFAQTTMDAVAREAGVSVGTLYNTFQGKEDLYERLTSFVKPAVPEEAVLDVIRLRLYNHHKDRLFFQPFAFPSYLGIEPRPEQLGARVNKLHQRYMDFVEHLFDRHRKASGHPDKPAVKMAVYLDGLITAFVGYWSGSIQADSLAKAAREMRDMLFRSMAAGGAPTSSGAVGLAGQKATCVNQFDFDRLKELISVVRVFGRREWQENADALDRELTEARVASPREVPADVVTMNSRVRIRDLTSGAEQVVVLVFPRDLHAHGSNVCILDPIGLALFGRRLGDRFEVRTKKGDAVYSVEELLYQPEAAGDFHI
jgi:regulator of nucleoside diphosphate kinase